MPAVSSSGPATAISRTAPSGATADLDVPAALGSYDWYGSTRFAGPSVSRQFSFAPTGEHRVIPKKIMPGARESVRSFRGHDVVLYEATDRSDAALVWSGPYNEATTWFGGPAPADGGARLVSSILFRDSPTGAALTPVTDTFARQSESSIIGMNDDSVMVVRSATDALPSLPDWSGLPLAGGELWRASRILDGIDLGAITGTPHEWRYMLAGPSAVTDLVLLGPESGRPLTQLTEPGLLDALGALNARWTA